jgi:uncharacterized coiled-coil DUF342 family protein
VQAAGLRKELHEAHAKVEQQATELGAVHQRAQALEEEALQLRKKCTALSLQKADVERQQDMHAEHAHIFRQAKPFEDSLPDLDSLGP